MEFTTGSNPNARYYVVEPIFFDDDVIGVLDGKFVQGRVARRTVTAFRVEPRSSFKHPAVGALVGVLMAGVPVQAIAGDPLGLWWLTLGSPAHLIGFFFLFCFGIYLLWGIVRRRNEPWLVFTSVNGERAFPLRAELPETAAAALRSIIVPLADEALPNDKTLPYRRGR